MPVSQAPDSAAVPPPELNSTIWGRLLNSIFQPFLSDFWGTVESVVTIAAVLIGGFWTYWLFVRRRLGRPRLNTSVTAVATPGPMDQRLLQIRVAFENVGHVLIQLGPLEMWVQQVSPLPDEVSDLLVGFDPLAEQGPREFPWPRLVTRSTEFAPGEAEIEPGERDVFTYDVLIPDLVTEVQVYVYAKNLTKDREIGWSQTVRFSIRHELSGPETLTAIGSGERKDMAEDKTSTGPKEGKQQPKKTPPEKLHERQKPKKKPPSTDSENES